MKRFSGVFGIALCAGLLLTGCDKLKTKGDANAKAVEKQAEMQAQAVVRGQMPDQAQTHYGRSMAQGNSADCVSHLKQAATFLYMYGDYLPTSKGDLTQNGCPAEILRCSGGVEYEFLVKGRVRNNGKIKVLRCPAHGKVLYSDGHVE